MQKYRAIPQGYMTVGELAKKMGTTVRTLQYYDKEGLLSPSAESEGGRRLYTDKDMVRLHQILSLKYLGFSLDDIKNRLIFLDTPADVANILTEQAEAVKKQLEALSDTLSAIETLKEEVLQMQSVDFKKYADIIANLQIKNGSYWLIKYFDDKTLEHCRSRFDKDSAKELVDTYTRLSNEAASLKKDGILPDSDKGQGFAKEFWSMIVDFTGGDMSLLPQLMEAGNIDNPLPDGKQQQLANDFIGAALEKYFAELGRNPFEEGKK